MTANKKLPKLKLVLESRKLSSIGYYNLLVNEEKIPVHFFVQMNGQVEFFANDFTQVRGKGKIMRNTRSVILVQSKNED